MANTHEHMVAGQRHFFGDVNRWMPLEWQKNIGRMAQRKELQDMLWRCVDVVDDYIIREKYGDDLYD